MRTIQKQVDGGYALNLAHATPPTDQGQAQSRWRRFRRHKSALLTLLLDEQYWLCCYSELRADEEGLGYHIEHVVNKSQAPARTFDYTNLAASALDSASLGGLNAGESFAGHAPGKQSGCDPARFVSCHQPDCSRFFAYLSDGRVVPAMDLERTDVDRARYTIELLNLNSPYLMNRRRHWWDELDELWLEHVAKGWNLDDLASIDLIPVQGKLSRFFSLTRQFFGNVAERVLRQQASGLL